MVEYTPTLGVSIEFLRLGVNWYIDLQNKQFPKKVLIENVVKYVWSMQSVNPAVQNMGPVGQTSKSYITEVETSDITGLTDTCSSHFRASYCLHAE